MEKDRKKVRPLRPERKNKSIPCERVTVIANHFPVNFEKWFPETIYHYDVVIAPNLQGGNGNGAFPEESSVPERLLFKIWKVFEEQNCKSLGVNCMPFDGKKNSYTARRLKFKHDSDVFVFVLRMIDPEDADKFREYRIQLKLVKEIDTSGIREYLMSSTNRQRVPLPQEVIQALDVVLRYCPVATSSVGSRCIPYNRSFYSAEGAPEIGKLIDLWFGHNQSLLLGRNPNQATLNIDMANKAFTKELRLDDVLRYILHLKQGQDIPESQDWEARYVRAAGKFLKGKLIKYESGEVDLNGNKTVYTFVANGLPVNEGFPQNSDSVQFTPKGKHRKYSIREFFQERGFRIQHPKWPVIHVGNRRMTNYVPMEICYIVPQAYKGKLTTAETTKMIQKAAKGPKERFERIKVSRDEGNFDCLDILNDFGMSVQEDMIEIEDARILQQPKMQYKDNKGTTVEKSPPNRDGKFKVDRLLEGAKISFVGLLNLSRTKDNVKWKFLEKLGCRAEEVGLQSSISGKKVSDLFKKLNVKEAVVTAKFQQGNMSTFSKEVRLALEQLKNENCQIVIVIIGDEGREYPCVKTEAEISVGILTQCVKETTVWKGEKDNGNANQLLFNIILKMNVKLNGKNFTLGKEILSNLNFGRDPILFLGADVTHPAPDSNSPSVAAITASYDLTGACYQMHIQVQDAGQEEINNFRTLFLMMLETYRKNTRTYPSRIIMFRDGVSEGQFERIKELEYEKGICAACSEFREDWNPKVTFLVVKKRHHTRFTLRNEDTGRMGVKPMGNIPPGTVVDNVITHPNEMEFFLNSHVGIQGTSKPTRYHVIHDDYGFSMEGLEQLTYCLCYTFMRCTQPVSYPAPTYYAHIAAFRARALIEREGVDNVNLNQLQKRMTFNPELVKNYPMFYI